MGMASYLVLKNWDKTVGFCNWITFLVLLQNHWDQLKSLTYKDNLITQLVLKDFFYFLHHLIIYYLIS